MKIPWNLFFLLFLAVFATRVEVSYGQAADDDGGDEKPAMPEQEECDGIFLTYRFISREKELPHRKNVSAQAWAFKSEASVLNAGSTTLKAWKLFIGFQHREILVAADGAVVVDGGEMPAPVGKNGSYFAGNPQTDLKNSIDTAGDYTQIQAKIAFKGTMFGLPNKATPMPKTIRIVNDGYKCPAAHIRGMSITCIIQIILTCMTFVRVR